MSRARGLVLFDLDGTLVDSAPDIADAVDLALDACGRAPIGEAQTRTYIGNGAARLIHRALTRSTDRDADAATFEVAYRAFLAAYAERVFLRSALYPGAARALRALGAAGWRLGCVTNKPERFMHAVLEAAGLDECFDLALGGDTLGQQKPHPEPLRHAARTLGFGTAQTVMVGDSATDVDAAVAAGVLPIAVDYGYAGGVDLAARGAIRVIGRLDELPPLLEHLRPPDTQRGRA
ncbi:MAG: phosphoglycolate phosphatase [Gammaproteobacteria bacterium]